jgi:hypothetical protein
MNCCANDWRRKTCEICSPSGHRRARSPSRRWNECVVAIEEHLLPFYRLLVQNGAQKARIEALADDHGFSGSRERLVQVIVDRISS